MTEKAVMSRHEAWSYVGGRPFFEELQRAYPQILRPIRIGASMGTKQDGTRKEGKIQYFKEVIDTALRAAQMDQRFVTSAR